MTVRHLFLYLLHDVQNKVETTLSLSRRHIITIKPPQPPPSDIMMYDYRLEASTVDDEESQNLLHPNTTTRTSRSRTPTSLLRAWLSLRPRGLRLRRHTIPPLLLLAAKALVTSILLILALTPLLAPSYTHLPAHYQQLAKNCADGPSPAPGCANPHNEKVFIATILYDKHGTLAGGKWGERVLELIQLLGPDNVFLSIYENDSGLVGRAALNDFEQRVPCRHKIVFDAHVELSDFPNITLPDGSQRIKRVAYLSELRNRALRPLDQFTEGDEDTSDIGGTKFDKVLFLNDIVFDPIDGAHLLFNTNSHQPDGRADYVAACALDWFRPLRIYDIYALRDAEGFANYQTVYPFFQRNGRSSASRADVLAQTDAVRAKSCWGGMMAMQARYVQNLARLPPSPAFATVGGHVVDPDSPRNITAPVRFRYEPEAYYDACECCLFSADLALVAKNEGDHAAAAGIVVNPYIRVAYSEKVLRWLPIAKRWERLLFLVFEFQSWFMPTASNPYRAVEEGQPFEEEIWEGDGWKVKKRVGRSGLFCGVRDMQLLQREGKRPGESGSNWVNTKMPPGRTLKFKSWWGETLPATWRNDWATASPDEQDAFFELPSGPGA
ncbi:cryptococcal mannosyltransferase 1-domain-containing protein [Cercophora scortea]|uniref:Cryptococcal mannosyltransferase 1-domain-containing protein n=1 Tax=Cercophora scortea TaxID=314031 RepID=A0AAE0MIS2_9PEZI|nr:cryptococcal mannosyltransferase 1-domain-containing protein [Cercophora scortea]